MDKTKNKTLKSKILIIIFIIITIVGIILFTLNYVTPFMIKLIENTESTHNANIALHLSDENKTVIADNFEINDTHVYKNSKCIKYFPIHEIDYIESVNYLNELFLDIGLDKNNTFKIDKITEGHGIFFYSIVSRHKPYKQYCDEFGSFFQVNHTVDCRYVTSNETIATLSTSFRVINGTLEGRYLVPCAS